MIIEQLFPIQDAGEASLLVELKNGRIYIRHGETLKLLAFSTKPVAVNTWDRLFDFLKRLTE